MDRATAIKDAGGPSEYHLQDLIIRVSIITKFRRGETTGSSPPIIRIAVAALPSATRLGWTSTAFQPDTE